MLANPSDSRFARSRLVVVAACALCLLATVAHAQTLASRRADGAPGSGPSRGGELDAAGDVVVFESDAPDLVRADGDGLTDIFLFDRRAGGVRILSVGVTGAKGNGASVAPAIDAGGETVVFSSEATNLLPADTTTRSDVYVIRSLGRGESLELVSVSTTGAAGDGASAGARVSGDGEVVVFDSDASDLAPGVAAARTRHVHVRDLVRGVTVRVQPLVGLADGDSGAADADRSGRRIVFETDATSFVREDRNASTDVVLWDRDADVFRLVSVGPGGTAADGASGRPRISVDGRFVAFESEATDLVAGDRNGARDVFVHDLATGLTERVSLVGEADEIPEASRLGGISADGRFVAFSTAAPLEATDGNRSDDVWIRDRVLRRTELVSRSPLTGRAADGASTGGSLSDSGEVVAFESMADDLLRGDGNGASDVWVVEREPVETGPFPAASRIVVPTRLAGAGSLLRAIERDGTLSDELLGLRSSPRALGVDASNVVWALDGDVLRRLRAADLTVIGLPAALLSPGTVVRDAAVSSGFAWLATDSAVLRIDASGDTLRVDLGDRDGDPQDISLALDTQGDLRVAARRVGGSCDLYRLSRDLRILERVRFPTAVDPVGFCRIAAGPSGQLWVRTEELIAKRSPAGAELWSRDLPGPDALAVDAEGRCFVVSGGVVLGLDADGDRFVRFAHEARRDEDARLVIDGVGNPWVLPSGGGIVQRLLLRRAASERELLTVERFGPFDLDVIPRGDLSGLAAAAFSERTLDSDADGLLDGPEADSFFDPFDPTDPGGSRRLPGVVALRAEATGLVGEVALRWEANVAYDAYWIVRDGRVIPGSPFPSSAARDGVVDVGVPGGVHRYRVIGQRDAGGGAGLDGFDEELLLEEPFSLSEEVDVSLGAGAIVDCFDVPGEPQAVARDPQTGDLVVALAGGELARIELPGGALGLEILPADPFFDEPIRGLAYTDVGDGVPALVALLADGELWEIGAGGVVDLALSLPPPPTEEGYVGLAERQGLLFALAGPGAECFIGFQGSDGASIGQFELGSLLGLGIDHSAGVATLPDGSLAFGVGGGGSTIDRAVRVTVAGAGADLVFADAGANVPLDGLGSTDIADLTHDLELGLLVADRSGRRVCSLEAPFDPAPRILSVDPALGRWSDERAVEIRAATVGDQLADIDVAIGGVSLPIDDFAPQTGVLRVMVPSPGRATALDVRLETSAGFDELAEGLVFGFRRGDPNEDGAADISDGVFVLTFLFNGGAAPGCEDAADTDDSGVIDISDAIALLAHLFLGAPAPPPPFAEPGLDPTADALGCGAD